MTDIDPFLQRFNDLLTEIREQQESYESQYTQFDQTLGKHDGRKPSPAPSTGSPPLGPSALHMELEDAEILNLLLDRNPGYVYIWIKDTRDCFLHMDRSTAALCGLSRQEAEGKPGRELFPQRSQASLDEDEEVIRTGVPKYGILEVIHTREGHRWLRINKLPWKDAQGHIKGLFGFGLDVTELKAAEMSLSASEERYRQLFDRANDAIFIADIESGTIVDANRQAQDLTGRSLEKLRGLHHTQIHPPEDLEKVRESFSRQSQEPNGQLEDLHLLRADGHKIPVEVSTTLVKNPDGRSLLIGIFRDLSDRIYAQEALQAANTFLEQRVLERTAELDSLLRDMAREIQERAQAQLQAMKERDFAESLIQTAQALVLVLDPRGKILRINPYLAGLTGYTHDEVLNQDWFELFLDGEEADEARLLFQKAMDGLPIQGKISWIRAKDGQRLAVEWNEKNLIDPEGQQMGLLAIGQNVTQRMKDQEQLLLQGEALHSAANAIVITDTTGIVNWVNPAFCELTGYPIQEVLGENIRLLRSGVQPKEFYKELWDTICGGQVWRGELINRRKDGRLYTEFQTITPVRDQHGTITHFVAIKEDVTEVRRTQAELKKLGMAVEQNPTTIVITDAQGRIEYANPRFTEMTGYTLEEAQGKTPRILKSGQTDPALYVDMWKTISSGQRWNGEVINRRKTGEIFVEKIAISPIFNAQSQLTHYVANTEDVTAIRQSEAARMRLAQAVDQAAEAMVIMELNHQVQYVNPAFCALIGMSFDEAIGHPIEELFPDLSSTLPAISELNQKGESWVGQLTLTNRKQAKLVLEGTISPVRNEAGRSVSTVAVLRDVTREMEMERHLRQTQKMDALGSLASGVAHDFNNILTAILSAAELLDWQMPPDSKARSKLQVIYQAAMRARELNRQILTFSRRSDERHMPFDISSLVKEVSKMLRSTLPNTIELKVDVSSSVWVQGDPNQMHQVIMNLAVNAYHAMQEKGGYLRLALSEYALGPDSNPPLPIGLESGRYAILTVQDTGCGMDAETLDKIFEPFFTTKEAGLGTGLGLSVVHGIVHKHGGVILVDSQVAAGSTFRVFLPCTLEKLESIQETPKEDFSGSERILLVDDEEVVAALSKQGLESMGYRVTSRSDSLEAFELYQNHPHVFDLVVLDLGMPKLSGVELTRRMRKIRPDLPIILVSGLLQTSSIPENLSINFDEILAKPHSLMDLARAIRRVMATRPLPEHSESQGDLSLFDKLPSGNSPLILLAEDSLATRALLRTWLAKAGYRVLEAKDGEEAWEHFSSHEPTAFALVLTDLVMPRLDGLSLTERIRRVDSRIPVVVLTTVEDAESVKSAMHLGVSEFLNKPFDSMLLLGTVKRLSSERVNQLDALRSAETAQAVRLARRAMEAVAEKDLPIFTLTEPLTDAGGDIFRSFKRPDGSILFVIADVAGHSVLSSYAVAAFLGMLATFVPETQELQQLLHKLNKGIQAGPFKEIPICTLAGQWWPDSGRVHLVNAGIPYAVWLQRAEHRAQSVVLNGMPLGIFGDPFMQEKVLYLAPQDRLLLGSDGFFDVQGPDKTIFQDQVPLRWAALGTQAVPKALAAIAEAARLHGQGTIADDLLLVGLEQPPLGSRFFSLDLASIPQEVERACAMLEALLGGLRNLSKAIRFNILLAAREALSNALQHGNIGQTERRIHLDGQLDGRMLHLRVCDEGLGFDLEHYLPPDTQQSERSRGIPILRSLSLSLSMRGGELHLSFNLEEQP